MKILTQLSATLTEAEFIEPRGVLQVVHAEPKPGIHVQISLGGGGLIIRRRDAKVGIPLAALLQLAGEHCPEAAGLPPNPAAATTPPGL